MGGLSLTWTCRHYRFLCCTWTCFLYRGTYCRLFLCSRCCSVHGCTLCISSILLPLSICIFVRCAHQLCLLCSCQCSCQCSFNGQHLLFALLCMDLHDVVVCDRISLSWRNWMPVEQKKFRGHANEIGFNPFLQTGWEAAPCETAEIFSILTPS
jgi:hypothetical protein